MYILARDKKTGGYVVIELKKGRAADKVFGQLSRYMGWVKKNLAGDAPVAGMIVGTSIDDKLRAARDAHDTKIDLVTYSSKMSFKVEYGSCLNQTGTCDDMMQKSKRSEQ